jgi:hypothetical protein
MTATRGHLIESRAEINASGALDIAIRINAVPKRQGNADRGTIRSPRIPADSNNTTAPAANCRRAAVGCFYQK